MKVLCVSHSSRGFLEARCAINALEKRFSPERLEKLPAFETVKSIESAVPFEGQLTLWKIGRENQYQLQFVGEYKPAYKVQSATFWGDYLLVYGADRLEVLDVDFKVTKVITDPWLAGGHTIYMDEKGFALVTSAPSNSVLRIDLEQGKVVERIPMPKKYGEGYVLGTDDSVHQHFVPTDIQPTHVNCAYPLEKGFLATLLIPGAVCYFGEDRQSREIICGFRGCHGGKFDWETREMFFTDSPAGLVWWVDFKTGVIKERFQIESKWIHDAERVEDGIFAVGLADKNELQIFDRKTGKILHVVDCTLFGRSVMFVNACQVSLKWSEVLKPQLHTMASASLIPEKRLQEEELAPVSELGFWSPVQEVGIKLGTVVSSETDVAYEYLIVGREFKLKPGEYRLQGKMVCRKGGVMLGLLELVSNKWLVSLSFDALNAFREEVVSFGEVKDVKVILTAFNPHVKLPVIVEVLQISLRQVL